MTVQEITREVNDLKNKLYNEITLEEVKASNPINQRVVCVDLASLNSRSVPLSDLKGYMEAAEAAGASELSFNEIRDIDGGFDLLEVYYEVMRLETDWEYEKRIDYLRQSMIEKLCNEYRNELIEKEKYLALKAKYEPK